MVFRGRSCFGPQTVSREGWVTHAMGLQSAGGGLGAAPVGGEEPLRGGQEGARPDLRWRWRRLARRKRGEERERSPCSQDTVGPVLGPGRQPPSGPRPGRSSPQGWLEHRGSQRKGSEAPNASGRLPVGGAVCSSWSLGLRTCSSLCLAPGCPPSHCSPPRLTRLCSSGLEFPFRCLCLQEAFLDFLLSYPEG